MRATQVGRLSVNSLDLPKLAKASKTLPGWPAFAGH